MSTQSDNIKTLLDHASADKRRLDWIESQGGAEIDLFDEWTCYSQWGHKGTGKTMREAIDGAMKEAGL